ncbi:hypothetical protein DID88_008438 [Monilinia fructigena]|uniref:NADP-dependent oxidoreductase domain-containing protein n=1 Tax=Monilinia fructigena TaxID=38457 RepID=A0A395J5E7_9HELO|nr:hypothetical protein DID88_008438 [Monilinia fructigena]
MKDLQGNATMLFFGLYNQVIAIWIVLGRLDYVDAFLMHWPFAAERTDDHEVKLGDDGKYIIKKDLTANLEPIWRKFEALNQAGKAKAIGVSNFTISNLEQLLKYAEIPPAINQVEIHPVWPNSRLINYCFSKSILPVAYSPLGSQSQVPTTSKTVIQNTDLISIAEKKGVSIGQILIAWGIKRGYVVLPMSSNKGRIKSNGTLIELTEEEEFERMSRVAEGKEIRFVDLKDTFRWDVFGNEQGRGTLSRRLHSVCAVLESFDSTQIKVSHE